MKLNNTYVLINAGQISENDGWKEAHSAIENAVKAMAWPDGSEAGLIIPKIVSIKPGQTYIDASGKSTVLTGTKPLTLRNGVVPLKTLFRKNLESAGWKSETPLSLKPYFEKIRSDKNVAQVSCYPPQPKGIVQEALHEGVGDFDFWLCSDKGFRTVIEWETGNISSSHRSLNKICLALMAGLVDAAVVIVPSNKLNVHLTDRVGNIRELQPYFYFWAAFGRSLNKGLLAIIEVEQDALKASTDIRDFIPRGSDGNAAKTSAVKTKAVVVRKRAKAKG